MAALMSPAEAGLALPDERGGWWHAFVCPVHGTELDGGDLLGGAFPGQGAGCRRGCRVDTPEVRGAWTALAHQACALEVRQLAASDEADDRRRAARALAAYADLYERLTVEGTHEGAAAWMLRGRMFHQALTEAIWAVGIGHAVRSLRARGDRVPPAVPGLLRALAESADAARRSLADRGEAASNYTAWLNAAHLVCSDASPREIAATVEDHLVLALRPDGWEWEGSTYYHLFVLRACLLSLRGCPPQSLPVPLVRALASMISALAGIATPSGELPELHDGPYRRPQALAEVREVAVLAAQLFDRQVLAGPLAWAVRHTPEPPRDLRGWFGGPPRPAPEELEPRRSFPDTGFAVVRGGGVHAVLDAGPHGGSHGHRDKLALYLYPADPAGWEAAPAWQPDLGQVPYAHRVLRDRYASAHSHPTFTVDGADQAEADARLVSAGPDCAEGECTDAYPGVRARRSVSGTPDLLVDVLRLRADREVTFTAHLRPAVPLHATAGADGLVRTEWAGHTPLHGIHLADAPARFTLTAQLGPADDPSRLQPGADWSLRGREATFVSVYRTPGGVPVDAVELSAHGRVTVTLADGTTHTQGE